MFKYAIPRFHPAYWPRMRVLTHRRPLDDQGDPLLAAHARVDDSALITRLIGIVLRLVKRIEICVDSIIQILLGQWVTMRVHGRARFLAPTNFMDLTVRQCSRMPGNAYRLVPFYALDIHKTLPRRHSEAQRPALPGARAEPERREGPGVALFAPSGPPDSARERLGPIQSETMRVIRAAQGMPAGAPGTARGAWRAIRPGLPSGRPRPPERLRRRQVARRRRDAGVTRELPAVAGGHRVHGKGSRHARHGRADRVRGLPVEPRRERALRRPVHQRHHGAAVPGPHDRVGLPVADPRPPLHHRRAPGMSARPGMWPRPAWAPPFRFGLFPRRRGCRQSRPPALRSARTCRWIH